MRLGILTPRPLLTGLTAIALVISGATAATAADPPPSVLRCKDGSFCVDTSMSELIENGLNHFARIEFHRHTEGGDEITLDGVNVLALQSGAPSCTYQVIVSDPIGHITHTGPDNWICGVRHNLGYAVHREGAVVTVTARIDATHASRHNLKVNDFCSGPPFCT